MSALNEIMGKGTIRLGLPEKTPPGTCAVRTVARAIWRTEMS